MADDGRSFLLVLWPLVQCSKEARVRQSSLETGVARRQQAPRIQEALTSSLRSPSRSFCPAWFQKWIIWFVLRPLLIVAPSNQIDHITQAEFCSPKALWKLSESSLVGWLSLKALRKQDAFRIKLYESRMPFVDSSTKAGLLSLKALQKQDDFRWKVYESRMTFVESSTKAFQKVRKSRQYKVLRQNSVFGWGTGILPFVKDPDLSVTAGRAVAQHLQCYH